jgi:hypothetical protein
LRSTGI